MLASIDLDHEVRLEAGEIRDIRRDRDLAAKAKTRYLLSAQPHPKALLGVGHRSSKPSGPLKIGARRDSHVSHCNGTPSLPSPVNGGGEMIAERGGGNLKPLRPGVYSR